MTASSCILYMVDGMCCWELVAHLSILDELYSHPNADLICMHLWTARLVYRRNIQVATNSIRQPWQNPCWELQVFVLKLRRLYQSLLLAHHCIYLQTTTIHNLRHHWYPHRYSNFHYARDIIRIDLQRMRRVWKQPIRVATLVRSPLNQEHCNIQTVHAQTLLSLWIRLCDVVCACKYKDIILPTFCSFPTHCHRLIYECGITLQRGLRQEKRSVREMQQKVYGGDKLPNVVSISWNRAIRQVMFLFCRASCEYKCTLRKNRFHKSKCSCLGNSSSFRMRFSLNIDFYGVL